MACALYSGWAGDTQSFLSLLRTEFTQGTKEGQLIVIKLENSMR